MTAVITDIDSLEERMWLKQVTGHEAHIVVHNDRAHLVVDGVETAVALLPMGDAS